MIDFSNIETYWPMTSSAFGLFITQGGLKPIFTSLNHMWYSKYGYLTERKAKLKEIENEYIYEIEKRKLENQEKFKNEIDYEFSKIPQTSLKEPVEYILYPAINESEQYLSNETLRNMFARTIASTFNQDKEKDLHSAFVQIIKQMTPLDAQNLLLMNQEGNNLIANLQIEVHYSKENLSGTVNKANNIYLSKLDYSPDIIASSIDNLTRLGLIKVDYLHYPLDSNYESIKQTTIYKSLESEINTLNLFKSSNTKYDIKIEKGKVSLTDFGKKFISVCLE
ncbi:TPA: DUF4393 domain-containing protein [Streptococcus equi subsp. zooepidemicus]|uniref:DUF4393 domain-containing protein n=1 Tax=Streptococcus equi TaxID=1336 RepID=UPI0024A83799|nr:DUF4393 domain-containing protein [Streptococcus equi]MDI5988671.1 DUF4393 domain-containing protein [Streptococcus equi subsp. zooepidemicus]HEL0558409.1 DUF4393 domain-containing protein [Streptococcus equi subsp. zooepidemicus]HEL0653018.1 DUF4393 domain-containing protein [Streptococcus equi subsp. zooepidemicus]HEL1003371.1 DUF4393 domain-containing protein [Streptococcus equi subsp. zooepidemicus]